MSACGSFGSANTSVIFFIFAVVNIHSQLFESHFYISQRDNIPYTKNILPSVLIFFGKKCSVQLLKQFVLHYAVLHRTIV